MNEPCGIKWCVSVPDKGENLCRIHKKEPKYEPSKLNPDYKMDKWGDK